MSTSSTAGRWRSSSERSRPGALGELGDRADARVGPAVVTSPHRQRSSPEAVARERPVDVVLEPVTEATVLDVLGVPSDRLVLAEQVVLACRSAREPCGLCPVDEWSAAAPAVRVGVGIVDDALEQPRRGQRVDDRRVGVLHELSGPRRGRARLVDERGGGTNRVQQRQAFGVADLAVDLAERRARDARGRTRRRW